MKTRLNRQLLSVSLVGIALVLGVSIKEARAMSSTTLNIPTSYSTQNRTELELDHAEQQLMGQVTIAGKLLRESAVGEALLLEPNLNVELEVRNATGILLLRDTLALTNGRFEQLLNVPEPDRISILVSFAGITTTEDGTHVEYLSATTTSTLVVVEPGCDPNTPDETIDGEDQNCDGIDGIDNDADGFVDAMVGGFDCDDDNAEIYPGAFDISLNGFDEDCDGMDGPDVDNDGFVSAGAGGTDCNDANSNVYPGASDVNVDGVDQDCSGVDGPDADGDGFAAASAGGTDCDDTQAMLNQTDEDNDGWTTCDSDCNDANASVFPFAQDSTVDQVDQNCDGFDGPDLDEDGFADAQAGGSDCDDSNAALNPGDKDQDGYSTCDRDCNDTNPMLSPGMPDYVVDGVDQDCSGVDGVDLDMDMIASVESGGTDCDDTNPAIYPNALDYTTDGVDQDCNGVDGPDVDGDGYASQASGGSDCNDTDPSVNPDAIDQFVDGIDSDCDGEDGLWAVQVVGGHRATCALLSNGSVECWGYAVDNLYHLATTNGYSIVDEFADVIQIASTSSRYCAVFASGQMRCWTWSGEIDVPADLNDAVSVDVAMGHACVVRSNGRVRCWGAGTTADYCAPWGHAGSNSDYECGQSMVPEDLDNVLQVSTGIRHTCALRHDGTVRCWGAGTSPEFSCHWDGTWPDCGQSAVPANLGDIVAIKALESTTLAITSEGYVREWGGQDRNTWRLGAGPYVQVVDSDFLNVCGLKASGEINCTGGQFPHPQHMTNVVGMMMSHVHGCAVLEDGKVECWQRGGSSISVYESDDGVLTSVEAGWWNIPEYLQAN
ncbi:MAG: hypothetical protein HOK97_11015 [Deltaproteobacteria bacterium]|jgi:hypothetical protein|nr:hypothetical protein [Deltaproteobacteria bacterium]